MGVSPIYQ
ncbi:MAG: hypothetical protein EZS28_034309, partial [Streblomastix strix]